MTPASRWAEASGHSNPYKGRPRPHSPCVVTVSGAGLGQAANRNALCENSGWVEGGAIMTSDDLSDVPVPRSSPCLTLPDTYKKTVVRNIGAANPMSAGSNHHCSLMFAHLRARPRQCDFQPHDVIPAEKLSFKTTRPLPMIRPESESNSLTPRISGQSRSKCCRAAPFHATKMHL